MEQEGVAVDDRVALKVVDGREGAPQPRSDLKQKEGRDRRSVWAEAWRHHLTSKKGEGGCGCVALLGG